MLILTLAAFILARSCLFVEQSLGKPLALYVRGSVQSQLQHRFKSLTDAPAELKRLQYATAGREGQGRLEMANNPTGSRQEEQKPGDLSQQEAGKRRLRSQSGTAG